MPSHRSWSVSWCLLALSLFPITGQADCYEEFDWGSDGSLKAWTICNEGAGTRVVPSSNSRFAIRLYYGPGLPEQLLTWRRILSEEPLLAVFEAVDEQGKVKIVRSHRREPGQGFLQSISVSNLSEDEIPNALIALEIGSRHDRPDEGPRSLAEYVYGFERIDVSNEKQQWKAPVPNAPVTRVALTSRETVIVLQPVEAVELAARPNHTASELSRHEPGSWQMILGQGALTPHGTTTYSTSISAVAAETEIISGLGDRNLLYSDLWPPFATLCIWVEFGLVHLSRLINSFGLSVVLFAVLIRLITWPASSWATRRQREYKQRFEQAKPQIERAKRELKGADQSERILAIYKENRITPFSGLKGSVGLLVQIPFLLAFFNVSVRSSIFSGEHFLWISDLAQPDGVLTLPIVLPILGGYLNVLPLALGFVNITSAFRQRDAAGSVSAWSIVFSLLIVAVFYSFGSALVLYWLTSNLLQVAESELTNKE